MPISLLKHLMRRACWLQGQLVLFTWLFALKGKTFAPYCLTSSFISGNCIGAGFPKLRNFRTYFAACCFQEEGLSTQSSNTLPPAWAGNAIKLGPSPLDRREVWIITRTTLLTYKGYSDTLKSNTGEADASLSKAL